MGGWRGPRIGMIQISSRCRCGHIVCTRLVGPEGSFGGGGVVVAGCGRVRGLGSGMETVLVGSESED